MLSCKKMLSIILVFALAFVSLPVSGFAVSQAIECPPYLDIRPERNEYSRGEDVEISTRIHNDSLSDLYDVYMWVEYDSGEAMLYPHSTERVIDLLPYSHTADRSFSVDWRDITGKIDSMNIPVLKSLAARIVKLFPKFTRHFVFLKNDIVKLFRSFSSGFKSRYSADLGSCSVIYDGREIDFNFKCNYVLKSRPVDIRATAEAKDVNQASVNFTAPKNEAAGIVFGADIQDDGSFDGWAFYVNATDGTSGIVERRQNTFRAVAYKNVDILEGGNYTLCVQKTTGGFKAWLLNDLSQKDDTFPLFDIAISLSHDEWGLVRTSADVYSDFCSDDSQYELPEQTYCNPVQNNAPDPFVLYEGGVYYLYSTNAPNEGFYADVSTDLVHWKQQSRMVAEKKDIYGENKFWAPEVYHYNEKYYMFYSAEEHMAVAVADSPLGPFMKAGDGFLLPERSIDGSIFFDDDGKIYLYYACLTDNRQNQLYVVEMETDLLHCKESTKTKLSEPEGWEYDVNEGPTLLKHNGTYYLTYSGNSYADANYGVGCMTSNSPTGPFTRYTVNPVLQSNRITLGCGHHCFTRSPDGSELFIVYHCHYSSDAIHPRNMCIDRVRFVPSANGADKLVIGGPTSTPQPMPK